jgi:alkylation response protein AidB-like acyl-CoA dehydrogenase
LKTIAGDKQCEVVFEKVKVPQAHLIGEIDQGWEYIKKLWPKIVIAQCAEMVGGAQQALEMAVDYAKERVQFGRPIGSFQAIQHYCANMAADVDGSRFITYQAAWMLDEGIPCNREVAIAKAFVSEAFHRVTVLAQQIHGALAFCVDHDLPLYYMRAKAWELTLGDSDFHREAVAQEIGL